MNKPIPITTATKGWEVKLTQECYEPLISLKELNHSKIKVVPKLKQLGVSNALDDIYVRKGVANKLLLVTNLLGESDTIIVFDGWRPPAVQETLYQMFYEKFKKDFPFMTESDLHRYTQIYVEKPSLDESCPSPHSTGGSIDLTLGNREMSTLFMGTSFMQVSERNKTRYYETKKKLNSTDYFALENRRQLYEVMTRAGFSNYEEAWWHFDYGNQWWAVKSKQDTKYGMADLKGEPI